MVPSDWDLASADRLCKLITVGIVITPSKYYVTNENGVRAFRSANVREGRVEDSNWVYLSQEGHEINKKSELQAGDVLVVRSGYPGTACVVPERYAGSNAIDIVIARPDRKRVVPEYLCAFTNSNLGKSQVLNLQGGMAQKHLNVGAYKKLMVRLPPFSEQQQIANILSTWDQAIETTEKLIENRKAQKKALMQQLLTGKKRLPGFSEEWQPYRLGQLFSERKEVNRLDLPLLSITLDRGVIYRDDVGRKDTSSVDKTRYKRLCPDDIGYNTMRMWQGVSALSEKEGIVSPAYTIVTPEKSVSARYMAYLFKLPRTVHDFYRYSQGLVSDTWNLKFPNFSEVEVFVPTRAEQEAIADILRGCDNETAMLTRHVQNLRRQKKSLMQQLLTGKRRVKVAA